MLFFQKSLLFALLSAVCVCTTASACPKIRSLPDYNCDGMFTISFFGDSILRGRTDPLYNGHNGSVPLRLYQRLKQTLPRHQFRVLNFSTPGITCQELHTKFRSALSHNTLGVAKSDVAVFNCGINDYFNYQSSNTSLFNLLAMKRLGTRHGIFSVVTNVSHTRISHLQKWIDLLNSKIKQLGGYIRFDLLNRNTMLIADKIHPNGDGFAFMFNTFYSFLTGPRFSDLGEGQLKLKDHDEDGIYDSFEEKKFGTSPSLSDTDGDQLDDEAEIFIYDTDPLASDTDADGVDDLSEITNGTDPRRGT